MQQTFLHIHDARGTYIPSADVMPWAFAIARRLLIDSIRHGRHELPCADEAEAENELPASSIFDAGQVLQAKELAGLMEKELARLPEAQRVAFDLVKEHGMSIAKAAEMLGTTVPTVKLRTHRAYQALRGMMIREERYPRRTR